MDLGQLEAAVAGDGVGIRSRIELEPLGGSGDKVFPPTYRVDQRAETKYATEMRRVNGADVPCVLLDSVASQANRAELALLDAVRGDEITLPLISVDFRDTDVASLDRISSLEAPHRVFDAILRDSLLGGVAFRSSEIGRAITEATHKNAAALFRWSPTTLLFGGWDSTGPTGGRGAKYERTITAEVVGINVRTGVKTSSRVDPLGVELKAGPIYQTDDGSWTLDEDDAAKDDKGNPRRVSSGEGADGRPSQVNHGNVTPSIDARTGGVTADRIELTSVISFPAIRRLRFPADGDGKLFDGPERKRAEAAARVALAALGLAATTFAVEDGFDLRSRCALAPTAPLAFEMRYRNGTGEEFPIDRQSATRLLQDAVSAARAAGLAWEDDEVLLQPAPRLVDLVLRSREIVATGEDADEDV